MSTNSIDRRQKARDEFSTSRELSVDTLSLSNRSSHEVVACPESPGVELTKYNNLTTCDSHQSSHSETQVGETQVSAPPTTKFNMTKSATVGNLRPGPQVEQEAESKCQTTIDLPLSKGASLKESKPTDQQAENLNEQFQVVWRRLSFEVELNSYDQILARHARKFLSFWDGSGSDSTQATSNEASGGQAPCPGERTRRIIFENLNGYFKSGEITAILGPSGAGKTTLLNAICGCTNNYRGTVQLIGGGKQRMRTSIIPQKDYLEENLTVKENLMYSSKLLNLSENFDHEANIIRVVKMLNLNNCLNSRASRISGGEYKRVSIAQELLRQPDIMVLDEPTSGLDSLNCKTLIKSLNELISASRIGKLKPIAIVMTIHQPDVDVFSMFDHVYCMGRGGRVVFDGAPKEVLDVMRTQAGFSESEVPPELDGNSARFVNPANLLIEIASEQSYGPAPVDRLAAYQVKQFESGAELMLDLSMAASQSPSLSPSPGLNQLSSKNSSIDSLNNYKQSNILNSMTNMESKVIMEGSLISLAKSSSYSPDLSHSRGRSAAKESRLIRDKRLTAKVDHRGNFWYHTWLLTKRSFLALIRDPFMTLASIVFHLLIPFVMLVVYGKRIGAVKGCPMIQHSVDMVSLASNNTEKMMEFLQEEITTSYECGTMFFLTTYSFSMCALSIAALAFPLSMHILLKEYRNGWYRMPSYVIARTVASLPLEILPPSVSIVMVYYLLDMPSSYMEWRLVLIGLVVVLLTLISTTQGLVIGALFMNSVQTAVFMGIATTLPLVLLSGYTARINRLPQFLQYSSWMSVYRLTTDAINIIRFGFGICPCDESTERYLSEEKPKLIGIPDQIMPFMSYYLASGNNAINDSDVVTTTMAPIPEDTFVVTQNITGHVAEIADSTSYITGISPFLILGQDERAELIAKLESNQIDLFARLASILTKSFTYGREVTSCSNLRTQILASFGTPPDEILPTLFGYMLILLIFTKLILFLVVKRQVTKVT